MRNEFRCVFFFSLQNVRWNIQAYGLARGSKLVCRLEYQRLNPGQDFKVNIVINILIIFKNKILPYTS